jgi:amidohydrolase
MMKAKGAPVLDIKKEVFKYKNEVIRLRRHFHQHPDPSCEEKETAAFVAKILRGYGVAVRERVGGYGVIGLIKGSRPGKCIALRADMDALRIQEENTCAYRSQNKGVMHACGHDAHTAMLLVAARILQAHRHELNGSVKLLFQPSEESNPGGALGMIRDGALENPRPDACLALHVFPEIPAGVVGIRCGVMMAQADEFRITVTGKSSHGSQPQDGLDPIVAAAQLVQALQTIVSRRITPFQPKVISVCTIHGGEAWNIIPGKVVLQGTVRSLDKKLAHFIRREMSRVLQGMAKATGTKMKLEYIWGYPPVVNDRKMCNLVAKTVTGMYGAKAVEWLDVPSMGGEDVEYFLQKAPGAMLKLGGRLRAYRPLHNAKFNLDENALPVGVAVLVKTAADYLNPESQSRRVFGVLAHTGRLVIKKALK